MITLSRMLSAVAFTLFVLFQPVHADANSGAAAANFAIKMPKFFHDGAIPCKTALERPLVPWEDLYKIQAFADLNELDIDFFAPNALSLPYIGREGFKPKPEELKCKTARAGKYGGLVTCPPPINGTAQEFKAWMEMVADLARKGLTVSPEKEYLVTEGGKAFYADYDLVSVRRRGENAYSEELRNALNELLGRRMFRHPPLVDYLYRDQIPIKFPILSFSALQQLHIIHTASALAIRFGDLNISWPW